MSSSTAGTKSLSVPADSEQTGSPSAEIQDKVSVLFYTTSSSKSMLRKLNVTRCSRPQQSLQRLAQAHELVEKNVGWFYEF